MKITELKRRRKHLYGVQFDTELDISEYGGEADPSGLLALDVSVCERRGIRAGMELSGDELCEIIKDSFCSRAKERAFWHLERSDCSKKQLITKLRRSFPEYAAEYAADKCEELGIIDDERYAARMAERYINGKKVSHNMAAAELRRKGVPGDIAKCAAGNVEYDAVENIKSLIERKYRTKLSDERGLKNTIAALARRGFSFLDIRTALKEFNEAEGLELYDD